MGRTYRPIASWEEAFVFDILEEVQDPGGAIQAEQRWLDMLNPAYNVSNLASVGGPRPRVGRKRTERSEWVRLVALVPPAVREAILIEAGASKSIGDVLVDWCNRLGAD